MTFCLHELSRNQEIQEKVRQSILEVLARHDGKITYESLSEMTYLEQCINGNWTVFRLNISSIFYLTSQSHYVSSLPAPVSSAKWRRTIKCLTPSMCWRREWLQSHRSTGFTMIPRYILILKSMILSGLRQRTQLNDIQWLSYRLVNIFPANVYSFIDRTTFFLGEGPRICIGMRFSYIETKAGLVTLLSKFRFHKSDKTTVPLKFSLRNIVLSPEGGLFLRVEQIWIKLLIKN